MWIAKKIIKSENENEIKQACKEQATNTTKDYSDTIYQFTDKSYIAQCKVTPWFFNSEDYNEFIYHYKWEAYSAKNKLLGKFVDE